MATQEGGKLLARKIHEANGLYCKFSFYPEGEEECYIFPCYVTSDGQVKHERSKGQYFNDVQTEG